MNDRWIPFFTDAELQCPCGECALPDIDPEFVGLMTKVVKLREHLGFPFPVNSGYRCPAYNDSLYKGDLTHLSGPHTKGALDIGVQLQRAARLVMEATEMQLGVGIRQHGAFDKRFVHLDDQGFRLWTYDALDD